jgi:hypothetical protein
MSKYGMGLLKGAQMGQRQLVAFAIVSAIVNGIVTALVGGFLAQSYASYQRKTAAIQTIADLVYERRTRAGMVVWAVKRNAETDELRYRKRAYDEAFVSWNKRVQPNIFAIRDISGEKGVTRLEAQFQELLVPGLSETDRCLTQAYDAKLKGTDALPILDTCHMADLHQFTLDCAATFTNELDRLTRLSFLPWARTSEAERKAAEARIDKGCIRPAAIAVQSSPPPAAVPSAVTVAPVSATATPPEPSGDKRPTAP